MNNLTKLFFTVRPTVTISLPLQENFRISHPDQVILNLRGSYHDIGACCYTIRSNKIRSPGKPREIVESSFLKDRLKPIMQAIRYLNKLNTDSGLTLSTLRSYTGWLRQFVDWADSNSLNDCLSGGDATKKAYSGFCVELRERYRKHQITANLHNAGIRYTSELLESITNTDGLARHAQKNKLKHNRYLSTEPAQPDDFAHALALNQSIFDGMADLVLSIKPFPYRLDLPKSLNWNNNFLWVFPLRLWSLPPHRRDAEREQPTSTHFAYNYEKGCLATVDEVAQKKYTSYHTRHATLYKRLAAERSVKIAAKFIENANRDSRYWTRIMLAMLAHKAFLFLFFANTGCNEAVAREIETDGYLDSTTLNQNFRSIKFRALGKPISLETPAAFLPALRQYMKLRRWLLNGASFPYLFLTLGAHNSKPPAQLPEASMDKLYSALRRIDPSLPHWGARKIRATVADYYQREHDASVTAKVLQNSTETAIRSYNAGSVVEHRIEMSLFFEQVAEMSQKQQIVRTAENLTETKSLEEGGQCLDYGHPVAMVDKLPVIPDCRQGQGCLFCQHRILIASEDDTRKVASAAFVMEQLILGPLHEIELRPLIQKCDADLEKIAAHLNCHKMVDDIKKDVFENGNLTQFFAEKFHLFLELGVIV